jgi:DNA-binding CsgD family transcriptional regulator
VSDLSGVASGTTLNDRLFSSLTAERMPRISIDSATTQLTDSILGYNEQDLADVLGSIASNIGVSHIAYLRFAPDKSEDTTLLTGAVTYSRSWQIRYFLKEYVHIDPVILHGRLAVLPFDWSTLPVHDTEVKAFFADAAHHQVGRNGLTIPVRNRFGVFSLVSFTSDCSADEWASYQSTNMPKLRLLSVLIVSAANKNAKLPTPAIKLSKREEQCLIWAARGKTYNEAAAILNLSFATVKSYLDTARHKLRCMNLTQAVAVAIATGVIPAQALK